MWCGLALIHFCRLQDCIALSTGEAELKAICKGTVEGLGLRTLVSFLLGADPPVRHKTDASAAFGVLKRKGAGQLKHLEIRQLWCQEVYRRPGMTTEKVDRANNPADLLCSLPTMQSLRKHLGALHFRRHD